MREWKEAVRQRLGGLRLESTREAEIVEELAQHLEDHCAELTASGMAREDAVQATLAALDQDSSLSQELERVERLIRLEPTVLGGSRRGNMVADFGRDLGFGLRLLRKNPGFTTIAVLMLALGIGINTSMFSVVNAVLVRPLPLDDPDRLVIVWESIRGQRARATAPNFADWREKNRAFSGITAVEFTDFNITGGGDPERASGARVTAAYFGLLGVKPILGRTFLAEDERAGASPVVVLSEGFWRQRLAADRNIVGKTLSLNRLNHTIVGVVPARMLLRSTPEQLWTPLILTAEDMKATGSHHLLVIARLKPGVSAEQADSEMDVLARQLESVRPQSNKGFSVRVVKLQEQLVGDVRPALLVLMAALGLVLLISCVNVANLLMARAASREREIAIRASLGASRSALVRQLLTEGVLLSIVGGGIGLALSFAMTNSLVAFLPVDLPHVERVSVDGLVLVFTVAVSLACGLLSGLIPALRAGRTSLLRGLGSSAPISTGSTRHHRARSVLVVSEMALSVLLLISAGLLIRSFLLLRQVSPGYNPNGTLGVQLALPDSKYPDGSSIANFYQNVLEEVGTIPGVRVAAAASDLPMGGSGISLVFRVEGTPLLPPGEMPFVFYRAISPEYFTVLQVSLLRGRPLEASDQAGRARVGVINETTARRYFSGKDPIGQRIVLDDGLETPLEIVGIVRDIKHFGLDSEPYPELYFPFPQAPPLYWDWVDRSLNIVLRADGDPASILPAVRTRIWSVDKDLPVFNTRLLDQLIFDSFSERRIYMFLFVVLASIALLLASVGLYGVISYSVAERTKEIGIRMALGAARADVIRLVLFKALRLSVAGVLLGSIAALGATRAISGMVFGTTTHDPITFLAVAVLLVGVATLAAFIPTARAMSVDPLVALRYE